MTQSLQWAGRDAQPHPRTQSTRIAAIEWTKILFALSIVCLHTGIFSDLSRPLNILIGNNLARLGVPFFLFVTGFYFDRQVKRGIGHLLRRMAGLYAIWTLIYLPFWISDATLPLFVTNVIVGYWQLWYLLAALISAVMLYLVRGLSPKVLIGLAVAILFLGAALQYGQRVDQSPVHESLPISADGALARNFLFFAFPFMALGYVAARLQGRWDGLTQTGRRLLLGVTGAIFAAEIGMNDLVFNAVGPFDIFLSSALFIPVLFLTLKGQGGGWQISPVWSTGIYLVHVLWINVLGMALPDLPKLALGLAVIALSLASVPVLRQVNRSIPVL
ncbi:acyltransferase family protein [Thioclava sp. GXIMD2076]|uniref:Acyltransferase family protein n=1 Tax=Thioclava kandeliae TaxID=3070818 RepID=A0ABV1SK53_9RHOB